MPVMAKEDATKKLAELVQLDIDASHAYAEALEKIKVARVRDQLFEYRRDHERHVTDLSAMIRNLGGRPPEYSRDFKGYVIQGMTALRSITGTRGALEAMQTNEKLTNRTYSEAMTWNLPADAKAIVERNFHDEQRHLKFIEQAIQDRVWTESGE